MQWQPKRGGIFGGGFGMQKNPWEIDEEGAMPHAYAQSPMQQPEPKRGFLDGGKIGTKEAIALALGTLGGGFSGNNMFGQFLAGNMMQKRKAEQQQKLAEQQRMAAREDKMWEWQNAPRETKPYRWRNNNGDLMELGPDGNPRVAYDDPQDKINWIQVKDPATGAIQILPVGPNGPMGGYTSAPDTLPADFFD